MGDGNLKRHEHGTACKHIIRPREYLTEEELERLITHHFNKPQLSYARDVFVFAAGFWDTLTSPPRRFVPKSPCRN